MTIRVPFGIDSSGRVGVERNPARILRQEVLALLGTAPGERVMLPRYGASLLPYVFENLSPAEQTEMQQRISDGMRAYVPQAAFVSLDMTVGPDGGLEPGLAEISLEYTRLDSLAGNPNDVATFTVGQP